MHNKVIKMSSAYKESAWKELMLSLGTEEKWNRNIKRGQKIQFQVMLINCVNQCSV